VLDRLLSVEFAGVAELREQAEGAAVTGLCDCGCPSVDLGVNSTAPSSANQARLSPVEGQIAPAGEPPGDIILFLDHGRLSYLEYVYYGDMPRSWPPIERVTSLKVER
jgi:hypothetical protein